MEMVKKQKKKIQTRRCVADISTGFVTHSTSSGDRGGGIVRVLDTGTIVGDVSFLGEGERTYLYKLVRVGAQQLAITPLIKILSAYFTQGYCIHFDNEPSHKGILKNRVST